MSRTFRLFLAIAWTLGIFIATLIPPSAVPDVNGNHLDKLVHFVMFFGFGWLWMWSLRLRPSRRFFLVAAAGLVLAVSTETLQGAMGIGRSADLWDVAANMAGLLSAMGLFLLWKARQHRPTVTS